MAFSPTAALRAVPIPLGDCDEIGLLANSSDSRKSTKSVVAGWGRSRSPTIGAIPLFLQPGQQLAHLEKWRPLLSGNVRFPCAHPFLPFRPIAGRRAEQSPHRQGKAEFLERWAIRTCFGSCIASTQTARRGPVWRHLELAQSRSGSDRRRFRPDGGRPPVESDACPICLGGAEGTTTRRFRVVRAPCAFTGP